MKSLDTHQSTIKFFKDSILKKYKSNEINKSSSIDNEIYSIKKFCLDGKNPHAPNIISRTKNSYKMDRYDIPFGDTKRINETNIRRILFSISTKKINRQLDNILNFLNVAKINHRDINPGNLIFSEKKKIIKLVDFYWAKTDGIMVGTPSGGINGVYGVNDKTAFDKIKNQIDNIKKVMLKPIKNIRKQTTKLGLHYFDGSSKHVGKAYHKIDIPFFADIKYHRNVESDFSNILNNISKKPKTVIDIGCAEGYNIFNLMRKFTLDKAIAYEADPVVFEIMKNLKRHFSLKELILNEAVNKKTKFDKVDLSICVNVHMWLVKQFGSDADIIIKNLINSSKTVFFQTAGKESAGMFKVENLASKKDVYNYLSGMTNKKVKYILSTKLHGGLRHLFKIGI